MKFMYSLATPLDTVKGIGPATAAALHARQLFTVKDLLLLVPLRYEDRSTRKLISQLVPGELVTLQAEVTSISQFHKGRLSMQSATIRDQTGRLKLRWFNNRFIVKRLVKGQSYLFSGKLNDKGMMAQPTVENISDDTIHTGRLVPIYSVIPEVAPTTLRRLLKQIIDLLDPMEDPLAEELGEILPLGAALAQLHFPDTDDKVIAARERLALEELLMLIQRSQVLKEKWREGRAVALPALSELPPLPFVLTGAQQRCIGEITTDLQKAVPMNRLLVGDVGSGKTAVCGMACAQVLAAGKSACLIAPTQILAEQHIVTFQKHFPQLPTMLVTSKTAKLDVVARGADQPTLYIGTHALLPKLTELQPALIIFDEQHRFGVSQRSSFQELSPRPHVLTLTATPIPRTLMLTIFAHLQLSVIDELPPRRLPVKTWLVPTEKRAASYAWIQTQLKDSVQCLVVCPFIDPSANEALENIAAATQTYEEIKQVFHEQRVALLHGRMKKPDQAAVMEDLFGRNIDVLVTTPIIEVGLDLPAATVMVIEAAERYGLASLHQLRGRVGRAGQQAYCLLFTSGNNPTVSERLQKFCQTHDGMRLAEQDLERRGAGDLFGTQQHGFDELQFANWSNVQLIAQAKKIAEKITAGQLKWQAFLLPSAINSTKTPQHTGAN